MTGFLFLFLGSILLWKLSQSSMYVKLQPVYFVQGEDSDMKIAPDYPSRERRTGDSAEDGAALFIKNRENGNIDKARELGRELARLLLSADKDVLAFTNLDLVQAQARLLAFFAISTTLEGQCPNPVVAFSALGSLQETLQDKNPRVSDLVNDSAVFSMYMLAASPQHRDNKEIGRIFAKQCEVPDSAEYMQFGAELYEKYLHSTGLFIEKAGFFPVER